MEYEWYGNGKGKVHPRTGHEKPEVESKFSSTLSLTSAVDVGWWLTPRAGRFNPRKKPGTHSTGGWVRPRVGLDGRGKSRLQTDSIPGLSSP